MKRRLLFCVLSIDLAFLIVSGSPGFCGEPEAARSGKAGATGALLRSAFVPGLGQLYNKKYVKAAIFATAEGWLAYGIYDDWRKADLHEKNFKSSFDDPIYQADEFARFEKARDRRNLKIWILALTVFYSMFDAYVDAQLSDFDQTDKAFEVSLESGLDESIKLSLVIPLQ